MSGRPISTVTLLVRSVVKAEKEKAGGDGMVLWQLAEFHDEAAKLLDERGVANLAGLGPIEVACRVVFERLRAADGMFS